jgi:hypothetical protein
MASVLSWKKVTGGSVVVSAVRGGWRDDLLAKIEFAVRRTVIHFSIMK